MKIKTLVLLAGLFLQQAQAQIPADTTNQRLYLLCKTWGYVKYFNQHKCRVPWDDLLINSINEVLASGSNADFNAAMMNMLNQMGNNVLADQGVLPDTNLLVNTVWINEPGFSAPVRNFLAIFSSHVYPDRSTCLVRFNDGTNPGAYGYIDFTQDSFNLKIDYGIESHRLTVMFYYWNLINYFFPYRNLMDQPWDSTLLELMPIFRKSSNAVDFHTSFLQLVTRINDSHGSTGSAVLTNSFWKGSYWPLISFERIENQCVVAKVDKTEGILPGDILTAMNGIDIKVIEDSLARFIPASTPASRYRDLYVFMLRGGQNSDLNLTLTDRQGQSYTRILKRIASGSTWYAWKNDTGPQASYTITSCGYGYINMGKLLPEEVPAMYTALKTAPAIIFDIRNYPNATLWTLAPLFFKSQFKNAIFYDPALTSGTGTGSYYYLPGWYYKLTGDNFLGTWNNPEPYTGKVYILVNQETQSQAEYTCQSLSYHKNSKVIGTQTAGADGNVTRIKLPGDIYTSFTALGTHYADGYQQQRNGVKIDSVVAPTIQGIREGKDEILLAALDCISGMDEAVIKPFLVSVYPNPATSGSVRVSLTFEQNSEVTITLIDLTGKTILQESRICAAGNQNFVFDLKEAAPGFYLLKTQDKSQTSTTKLEIR